MLTDLVVLYGVLILDMFLMQLYSSRVRATQSVSNRDRLRDYERVGSVIGIVGLRSRVGFPCVTIYWWSFGEDASHFYWNLWVAMKMTLV